MTDLARSGEGRERTSLKDLALLYLKLGTIAFGGPAAHIAMFEDEVVGRRAWLTRQQFLDFLAAANLLPGPSSTEMAIYIGQARSGAAGLFVAGTCFIMPAALIVGALAWAYTRYGTLPAAVNLLYGVKPVVIAVVLQALWRLGRAALKTPSVAGLAVAATIANAVFGHELLVLAAAAALGLAVSPAAWRAAHARSSAQAIAALPAITLGGTGFTASLSSLFWVFLKIGATVFGSGYVLLAFLRADLVQHYHWLTESQLLDAVAVGQVTPGPVFTTATFIGYLVAGAPGAAVATVGIFLPGFLLVGATGPIIARLRASPMASAALDGVNAGALALIAVVTWQLGRTALVDATTVGLAFASAVLLLRYRVNSAWLVLGGAALGLLAR